jgi:hypothetical protein
VERYQRSESDITRGGLLLISASQRATQTGVQKRTTKLRQFARKLAESADASERKIGFEKSDAARKMGYFLRFVRSLAFEQRLLRM